MNGWYQSPFMAQNYSVDNVMSNNQPINIQISSASALAAGQQQAKPKTSRPRSRKTPVHERLHSLHSERQRAIADK